MNRRNREISIFSMSALDLFASALGAFILLTIVIFPYFPNVSQVVAAPPPPVPVPPRPDPSLQQQLEELQDELAEARRRLEEAQGRLAEAGEDSGGELEEVQERLEELAEQLEESQERLERAEEDAAEVEVLRDRLEEAEERYGDVWDRYQAELRRKFLMIIMSWDTTSDVDLHIVDPRGNEYYFNARRHPPSAARFEEDTTRGPGNEIWLHPAVGPGDYTIFYSLFSQRGNVSTVRGSVVHSLDREELPDVRLSVQDEKPRVATVHVDAEGNVEVR